MKEIFTFILTLTSLLSLGQSDAECQPLITLGGNNSQVRSLFSIDSSIALGIQYSEFCNLKREITIDSSRVIVVSNKSPVYSVGNELSNEALEHLLKGKAYCLVAAVQVYGRYKNGEAFTGFIEFH